MFSHILPHEESTEQQPDRDAVPPRSSELYPPELPCWRDQSLSEIIENKTILIITAPVCTDVKRKT